MRTLLLVATLAAAACAPTRTDPNGCTRGTACTCTGAEACVRNCPDGGCDVVCSGSGSCDATCNGGGCSQVCSGSGECTLECGGGGCHQTCAGTGMCRCLGCGALDAGP